MSDQFSDAFDFGQSTATVEETPAAMGPVAVAAAPAMDNNSIDINNLDLYNDVEEIDADASVYDQTPPPPTGTYILTITPVVDGVTNKDKQVAPGRFNASVGGFVVRANPEKGRNKDIGHLYIVLDYSVEDEGKPWHHQSRREWENTMKAYGKESTPVDTLLMLLTGKAGVGLTNGQKVDRLFQCLVGGQNKVVGDLDWELVATEDTELINKKTGEPVLDAMGQPKTERRIFTRGMRNFPQANGKYQLLDADPKTGAPGRTRYYIKSLKPIAK